MNIFTGLSIQDTQPERDISLPQQNSRHNYKSSVSQYSK
jgi:hypothetical protein